MQRECSMVLKQCRHGRTESPPAPVTGLVSFMGHQCVCRENPKQLAVWLCARPGSACQRSPFLHSCSCTASAGCCLCSLAPALLISLERHNGEPQEQAGWRQLCPQHPASQMVPPPSHARQPQILSAGHVLGLCSVDNPHVVPQCPNHC